MKEYSNVVNKIKQKFKCINKKLVYKWIIFMNQETLAYCKYFKKKKQKAPSVSMPTRN